MDLNDMLNQPVHSHRFSRHTGAVIVLMLVYFPFDGGANI